MHGFGSGCTNVVRAILPTAPLPAGGGGRARLRRIANPSSHATMSTPRILDEIGAKLSELAANSPVRDIEKNARALLGSAFGKLDLVTREEFEVQREVLAQARVKLAELEARVAELEARLAAGGADKG